MGAGATPPPACRKSAPCHGAVCEGGRLSPASAGRLFRESTSPGVLAAIGVGPIPRVARSPVRSPSVSLGCDRRWGERQDPGVDVSSSPPCFCVWPATRLRMSAHSRTFPASGRPSRRLTARPSWALSLWIPKRPSDEGNGARPSERWRSGGPQWRGRWACRPTSSWAIGRWRNWRWATPSGERVWDRGSVQSSRESSGDCSDPHIRRDERDSMTTAILRGSHERSWPAARLPSLGESSPPRNALLDYTLSTVLRRRPGWPGACSG